MANLLKNDDFLVKVAVKNRFFTRPFAKLTKISKCFLAVRGGEEGNIFAFFAQRKQIVGNLPEVRLYWKKFCEHLFFWTQKYAKLKETL